MRRIVCAHACTLLNGQNPGFPGPTLHTVQSITDCVRNSFREGTDSVLVKHNFPGFHFVFVLVFWGCFSFPFFFFIYFVYIL